jgi:WS/DGAT/MGAT family acyltransferase
MTAARKNSETFSSVDAAWLHMDTPTNLAVITGVLSFKDPLDYHRLVDTIENRLLVHRRFKQRVREPHLSIGLPSWEYDPDFDLDNHLVRAALSDSGSHEELQRLVGDLMSAPLDPSKPLWKLHLIENYGSGSALVCRLHHCIADGLALVQLLLAMADESPDATWTSPAKEPQGDMGVLARMIRPAVKAAEAVGGTWRTASYLFHEGMETITHPYRLWDAAKMGTSATLALSKLLLIGPDRKTVLRGDCDIPKRAAWSKIIDLEEVKAIGRLMGATVNDILLSAVTGALRRYLEERGEPVVGLNIRTIVPVNLRPPSDTELTGNRFGLVFLSLPVGLEDPLQRLVVLRHRMNEIKESPEAVVAFGILGAIGMSPTQIENIIISIFGMKGTAVMTNVPGPRRPLYLAGSQIDGLMFWVPTPANLGLGVSIISYAGDIILGVSTDEGLVPDPESILGHFHLELEEMKRWGSPAAQKSSPKTQEQKPKTETKPDSRCQALTKSGLPCKNRARPGTRTCHIHRAVEETV